VRADNIDLVCDTGPEAVQRTEAYYRGVLGLADTAGTCNDTLVALCGPARDYHSCPSCLTKNQAALSAAGCSTAQLHTFCRVRPYDTECPAPKAAIRVEDMKLLVECYDLSTAAFTGRRLLYNLTAVRFSPMAVIGCWLSACLHHCSVVDRMAQPSGLLMA